MNEVTVNIYCMCPAPSMSLIFWFPFPHPVPTHYIDLLHLLGLFSASGVPTVSDSCFPNEDSVSQKKKINNPNV